MVKIIITTELTEWLMDRLSLTPDEALEFAQEFAGLLFLTGAITPPPATPDEAGAERAAREGRDASRRARWG